MSGLQGDLQTVLLNKSVFSFRVEVGVLTEIAGIECFLTSWRKGMIPSHPLCSFMLDFFIIGAKGPTPRQVVQKSWNLVVQSRHSSFVEDMKDDDMKFCNEGEMDPLPSRR